MKALIGMADVEMKDETTVSSAQQSIETASTNATSADQKESVGEAYARLGIQYYKYKGFDKAIEVLESAQKNLSAKSAYQINVDKVMAQTYLQLKKYDKADEYCKKALAIDPKDEDAKKIVDFLKQVKGKKQ